MSNHVLQITSIIFFGFFCLLPLVSAATTVGVSPGNVDLQGVLRGGYAERVITLTGSSEDSFGVTIDAWGDIADWFNYTEQVTVNPQEPQRVPIAILPPSDIPNGNYTGFIRFSTAPLSDDTSGPATAVVQAVIDVAFTVGITDIERVGCRAQGYRVATVEQGDDLDFYATVRNDGNVRLRPEFNVEIWDQEQITLVHEEDFRGGEILPTRSEEIRFSVSTDDFELDQYWATVSVTNCFSDDLLTFDIVESGALTSEGLLRGITAPVWSDVGETIPILVLFENVGEKSVDARFEGRVTREGKILQILDSPELRVPMGESTNFTFFYTPQKEGQYLVSGRVFYDKKRTFESSVVFNAISEGFSFKKILLTLGYVGIITFIVFLFYKIRKERRRYVRRLR